MSGATTARRIMRRIEGLLLFIAAIMAYMAIELAYICDKIYNGWPNK
jgi:hypothetical protein